MPKYNHKKIEKKWKKYWDKEKTYQTKEDKSKPKYFVLDMFPYPSGAGLHVGHPKGYIATDVVARMKMMQGYNVLHPMGWDAFGLPAENYALANKMHPAEATEKNVEVFKKQLGLLGFTYDWDREVNTTDPKYYKWTQWAFLQMFKKGLAYESFEPINWCPKCLTGLANEDLEDGKCERCGTQVVRKPMRQWVLKITDYAERLLNDLDKLDKWPNPIKEMQRNWIGKSEGAEVDFEVKGTMEKLKVFTTRPDTLFGATYMVLAPEHKFVIDNLEKIQNKTEVEKYIAEANKKSDLERTDLAKEKTGVELKGVKAINPVNGEELPIFVADYVITGYGTGAIMAVPAHDERDWEFAKKYNLPIKEVLKGGKIYESAYTEDGIHVNSGFLDNLDKKQAIEKVVSWLEEKKIGQKKIQFKLRDWVFSRQRYWGEPIPLVHCENCKNKKYRYLLLHGRHGKSTENFFPWLKNELESKGYEVFCPELPDTDNPKVEEQADFVIKNFSLDENTVIVGHSLGGPVALNILEKTGKKVAKVVMVDSPIKPEFTDMPRPDLERNFHWRFNYKKIKELSEEFVTIIDDKYPIITSDQFKTQEQELGANLIKARANGRHFCSPIEPIILASALISGVVPVPEKELPVELPKVKNYEPSGTGESPLATIDKWVNTKCPHCGGPAKRETNTMPQWAGSCWYYLRYIDPHNDKALVDKEKEKYWSPVDFYVGGAEHATRHLIYARFWHKFLFDIGAVNYDEPFTRLQNVGLILAEDGRKMSKRWGNVINPDDIVAEYGADSMRIYEMFMGPFDQACAWSTNGLIGARRFVEKVWALQEKLDSTDNKKITTLLHQTIKKVSDDIENMRFNTAISQLMILTNEMGKEEKISKESFAVFIKLLSPFAPHTAEEIWNALGNKNSIVLEPWPKFDASLAQESEITLAVQVNGKLRDTLVVSADISEEAAKQTALASEKVQKWLEGKQPKKVIYVKGKLISIVV